MMKSFLVLTACIVTVSSISLLGLNDATDEQKLALRKCFLHYKIDPDILEIDDDKPINPINKLTGEQQGCVAVCLNKHYYTLIKPDGSIDIEKCLKDVPVEKKEELRRKVESIINECRTEAGPNDCKFIHCIGKKGSLLKA